MYGYSNFDDILIFFMLNFSFCHLISIIIIIIKFLMIFMLKVFNSFVFNLLNFILFKIDP